MSFTYLGELTLGGALPGAAAAAVAGVAGINLALPDIQARLDALLAFTPTPVDFGVQLQLALQMVASVQSSIALGLPAPSILLQLATVAALVAALEVSITSINTQLGAIVAFQAHLAAPEIHAYAFQGATNVLGAEAAAALAGGLPGWAAAAPIHALVLATPVPATWTAMGAVMKVTP
jgi:hypothetical protein